MSIPSLCDPSNAATELLPGPTNARPEGPSPSTTAYGHLNVAQDRDWQRPSSFSSADSVLLWPIFGGRYAVGHLAKELFIKDYLASQQSVEAPDEGPSYDKPYKHFVDETEIPELIDRFFYCVHTKNPILDIPSMQRYTKGIVENGLGWDAPTALVVRQSM